ncbi:MAG: hypothetical protein JJE04_25425 [Acidobacteriia bacterium]|nr:hypothetical protein [Terriglobia bacterium]
MKAQLLAKVSKPLLNKFNTTIERACLRRDAYLDHVFAHEANILKDEIQCRNSPEARIYLQNRLEDLERVPVNFSLSLTTIAAVNRACEDLNVIRDCFINRVLFLLQADINVIEIITGIEIRKYLPDILGDHDRDYLYAPLWGGGLSVVSEIVSSDPFQALRNAIDHFREQGNESVEPLHACLIIPEMFSKRPSGALALNCYLPDKHIPDSPAAKRAAEDLDELFGELTPGNPRALKPEKERKKAL